jgi:two-component system, OmpR family, sensor kinase
VLVARRRGGDVELHVTDDGPGFPPGLMEHAFERFTRGEAAEPGTGSGLGMAIVAAIAHAHGGRAGARNVPDGGADVWISLPAAYGSSDPGPVRSIPRRWKKAPNEPASTATTEIA